MATAPKDNPWENLIKKANRHTERKFKLEFELFPKALGTDYALGGGRK
jgi:hypothetical protein